MLAIKIKHKPNIITEEDKKDAQDKDIIVEKFYEEETYKDGVKITKIKSEKTNLTKKINSTKKLIKNEMAKEKIAELNKLFN